MFRVIQPPILNHARFIYHNNMPTVTLKPFYEQERMPLPEKVSGVLTANNLRIGAGNDIFAVGSSGFIFRSTISQSTVSGFDNSEEVINQVKVTNTDGKNLLPIIERVVYVGSRATANILPGGSSIDESQYQIIGDIYTHVDSDGSDVEINEVANWRYIRNISAGTVTLLIDVYVRYLVNTT